MSHRRALAVLSPVLATLGGLAAAGCAPPDLLLEGIGAEGGPYTTNAFVTPDEKTTFEGRIANIGGQASPSPTLTFAELFCLEIDHAYSPDDIDGLAAGEGHSFAIAFTATGCTTTTIVDWFLDAEGDEYRGTFNLHLQQE